MGSDTGDAKALLKLARHAWKNAYAPYSKFPVGACALFEKFQYFPGCNIENASYGMTLCAERIAVSSGISAGFKLLKAILIFTKSHPSYPCGGCRQWIFEFSPHCKIYIATDRRLITTSLDKLLPAAFWL